MLLAIAGQAVAQNEYDALRFSQTYIQGTARSAAMGGAFGALGGDISCMSINPAGIGIYKEGEACISLELISNNSKVTPTTGIGEESKFSMKIPTMGFVAASGTGATSGYTGWAFGIGFNRLNDFSLRESFDYNNPSNSILDAMVDRAQGCDPDNLDAFSTGLFYNTVLIDNKDGQYCNPHSGIWDTDKTGYGQRQRYNVDQRGGINCWDFSFAGSFNDQLFFGASLGLQTLNYKTTNVYKEDDENDAVAYEHFDYSEFDKSYGAGVNVKLGVLYKPIQYVRVGAAIHTPTVFSITEKYYTKLKAVYDSDTFEDRHTNSESYSDDFADISDDNEYKYRLVTPFKSVLSAAFVYPGYGLISFDYENVNYSKTKLRNEEFDDYDFIDENEGCKTKFKSTNNFRIGAEGLAGPVSIRAGYALYGNPLNFVSGNKQRQIISGGIGLKLNANAYFDLTASYHIYQTGSYIYESAKPEHSMIMNHDNRYLHIMATLGYKF